jgi:hypothetical protein
MLMVEKNLASLRVGLGILSPGVYAVILSSTQGILGAGSWDRPFIFGRPEKVP